MLNTRFCRRKGHSPAFPLVAGTLLESSDSLHAAIRTESGDDTAVNIRGFDFVITNRCPFNHDVPAPISVCTPVQLSFLSETLGRKNQLTGTSNKTQAKCIVVPSDLTGRISEFSFS